MSRGTYCAETCVFVLAAVARLAPGVELLSRQGRADLLGDGVHPRRASGLSRPDRERHSAAGHFRVTGTHGHGRGVVVSVGVDAVLAGAKQGNRDIRRIHLKGLVIGELPEADVQRAIGEAQLHRAVVQVEDRHGGARRHADGRRAGMDLGAAVGIGPEMIAGG